jgi:DNA-binding transcriptional LysR family regulator
MNRRYRDIPIELLRSFVTINDLGSYTKAADELHLTQGAISAQIRRLQQLVGGTVFNKGPLGSGLTDRGKFLETYARRILALNDQIMAYAGSAPQGQTLRLGIQNFFAESTLAHVIEQCVTAQEFGQIQFVCESAPNLLKLLESGYVDLIFAVAPFELRLQTIKEWTEPLAWSCSPTMSLKVGQSIPLIVLPAGFIDSMAIRALEFKGIPYTIVFSASDMTARRAAAMAGIGYMAVPERCLPDGLIKADDSYLPKLPALRAGIFHKEGLEVRRIKSLIDAFCAAIAPPEETSLKVTKLPARSRRAR